VVLVITDAGVLWLPGCCYAVAKMSLSSVPLGRNYIIWNAMFGVMTTLNVKYAQPQTSRWKEPSGTGKMSKIT